MIDIFKRYQGFLTFSSPFVCYLVLTLIAGEFPDHYPGLYSAATIITGLLTAWILFSQKPFPFHGNVFWGIVTGIAGIVIWIVICRLSPEKYLLVYLPDWLQPDPRPAFNPFESIQTQGARWTFIFIRLLGLSLLVPIAEELFWRGFIMRWLLDPEWEGREIGVFTTRSFIGVTLLFTLAHPEWLAAAIYCILINVLIHMKKDIFNCVAAHAISNLILGIYVITTENWGLW